MKIRRNKLHDIILIVLVVLCVPIISVCDCLINNQIIDSFDNCEWENYSLILNPLEENIPDTIANLPLDTPFPLIAVTSSQVFHPPTIV